MKLPKLIWMDDPKRKAKGRWTAKYKGRRMPPFGDIKSQHDRESKRKAKERLIEWMAEVDAKGDEGKPFKEAYELAIRLRRDILEWIQLHEDEIKEHEKQFQKQLVSEIAKLEKDFSRVSPKRVSYRPNTGELSISPLVGLDQLQRQTWLKRLNFISDFKRITEHTVERSTIEHHATEYLAAERARVNAGQIEAGTYKATEERLKHFQTFCGQLSVERIDASLVRNFHTWCLEQVSDETFSPRYTDHIFKAARRFIISWLYENDIIEKLPKNLMKLHITVPHKEEIKTWKMEEVKEALGNCSERTRLYLLLAINCGYYGADVASLKQSHVDWTRGIIKRKRKKTEKKQSTPVVSYVLWDETFELLKKHRSQHEEWVLVNENGGKLQRKTLKKAGGVSITNNIVTAFGRLQTKLKKRKKNPVLLPPMANLRHTSSTFVGHSKNFKRYAQYFLGQAPDSVADRFYVRPNKVEFFRAVIYLGKKYGFSTKVERVKRKKTTARH